MNLPNSLTLLRIFFVPVLIVILLTRSPNVPLWGVTMHFEVWGVLILLMAAATDWADGYLARRRMQITTLGILLDPIADKLLISAAFIALVDMHLVKAWMVVIIIGREFTVLGLRNIASAEGFTIAASALGKTKMVLQVCAVALLIAGSRYVSLHHGVFVTLEVHGNLHGCIGVIEPRDTLKQSIAHSARSAALDDPRFPALLVDEIHALQIEISVLSPISQIDPKDVEIGKHGLVVATEDRRGLLLPQVAPEHHLSREQFLDVTRRITG